jgi:hypothetical protein
VPQTGGARCGKRQVSRSNVVSGLLAFSAVFGCCKATQGKWENRQEKGAVHASFYVFNSL